MIPVCGERSRRRVALVIRGRRVRELALGAAALRLAGLGQANESDTQRLEGQPPARRNLSSLTVSGQLKAEDGPLAAWRMIATEGSVTSLDRYPSTRVHASTVHVRLRSSSSIQSKIVHETVHGRREIPITY